MREEDCQCYRREQERTGHEPWVDEDQQRNREQAEAEPDRTLERGADRDDQTRTEMRER